MPTLPRTVEQLVEDQAHRWEQRRDQRHERPLLPVIAISRQHGAGGSELARRLAEELQLDLLDREIIQQIAENAHLSERVVQTLDERDRKLLTDWLLAFGSPGYLSPVGYRDHLTRVVGTIARHGGAVILGRGAHLILGPHQALRVLVVAPLEARVAAVMRREGLSERDARRRIAEVEAERAAFLKRHFRADFADLASFDLAVNTADLGLDAAVSAIRAALAGFSARPSWP
jgi:cytidylate kinase